MDRQWLEEQLRELPLVQYEFFPTDTLVFSPKVRHICRQECAQYNRSWACPPAVGEVEDCETRCRSYPNALLLVSMAEVEDAADLSTTLPPRLAHETLTHQVLDLVRRDGTAAIGLSTESCAICETCAWPEGPCRHPEKMLPCVESQGILVTELAERFGIDFLAAPNLVTWFSLVLYRN